MPLLSIIIPTKNEEKMLPRLLESIKAQTFTDFEMIVADAQSTDQTRKVAAALGARVVRGGMPGPGRNRGAAQAKGSLFFFFDADVVLPSTNFLGDCIAEFQRKKFAVATCRVKPISRKPIDRALHQAYNAYVMATEKLRPHAPGFCILVTKEAHNAVHGFNENVVFAEDHDYVQRIRKQKYKFGILRSHPIAVSVRRLEKDGRLSIALKYIFSELHMMTKGSMKKTPFRYDMGGSARSAKKKKL